MSALQLYWHEPVEGATLEQALLVQNYIAVKFQSPNLQKNFDRCFKDFSESGALTHDFSNEDLEVHVLMSMYSSYRTLEDGESARTQEIIDHLLCVELRPALRSYYRRLSEDGTDSFAKLRDHLADLVGERFV